MRRPSVQLRAIIQLYLVREAKREHKIQELALLQSQYLRFQLVVRELAGVFFKDGFHGLGRGRVKKNDGHHILTKGLCDAGELLGQHPHADAFVAGRKAEFDKLTCPTFHIF